MLRLWAVSLWFLKFPVRQTLNQWLGKHWTQLGVILTILQVIKIRIFTEEQGPADIWPANCEIQIHCHYLPLSEEFFKQTKTSQSYLGVFLLTPPWWWCDVEMKSFTRSNIPILINKINESSQPNLYAPGRYKLALMFQCEVYYIRVFEVQIVCSAQYNFTQISVVEVTVAGRQAGV